jgi:hypothetical protein
MTIDRQNQADAFARLVGCLVTNRAIAFVGAGYSARALTRGGEPAYPIWNDLLNLMHERVERIQPGATRGLDTVEDPLWRAEEYRRLLGDEYVTLIRETYGPCDIQLSDFHKTLILMPFRHFLTTNYDFVLEEALQRVLLTRHGGSGLPETESYHTIRFVERTITWNDRANLAEFCRRIDDISYDSRIVHVHGRYDQPESIVLTERDYASRYIEGPKTYEMLWALGVTHPFVFIGFSANDFDIMAFFRAVRAILGPEGPEHFILYGLRPEQDGAAWRRMLRGKFGVNPVYYEITEVNRRSDHSAVETLIAEIHQAYRNRVQYGASV